MEGVTTNNQQLPQLDAKDDKALMDEAEDLALGVT